MAQRSSPTVRRRELGILLRGFREAKGLTAAEVAAALEINPSQISRLETAQRQPVIVYVKELCKFYGLDDQTTGRLVRMARESREEGWWQQYDLESPVATYLSLETAASSLRVFENYLIPGLLQTRDYAAAILESLRAYLRKDRIAQTVESRVARQQILTEENALQFHAIIGEGALHQEVGGKEVMIKQIRRIYEVCELPTVTVQVLPFTVGAHPAMDGPFTIMTFAEEHMRTLTYSEGPLGEVFHDSPEQAARRLGIFGTISTLAANPEKSRTILEECIEALSRSGKETEL